MADPDKEISQESIQEEAEDEQPSRPPGIMRRIIGPAAALVVLYASIRAFPALLVNQAPPINGDHLFITFIIGLAFFSALSLYFDRRESKKDPDA